MKKNQRPQPTRCSLCSGAWVYQYPCLECEKIHKFCLRHKECLDRSEMLVHDYLLRPYEGSEGKAIVNCVTREDMIVFVLEA